MKAWVRLFKLLTARAAPLWAAEIAGITALAAAGFMVAPALCLVVVGIYLVIVANAGGE